MPATDGTKRRPRLLRASRRAPCSARVALL